MAGDDFRREYLGAWPAPDPVYLRAVALWLGYYVDCDAFDGTRGPVPDHLRAASVRFARERLDLLRRDADAERIPERIRLEAKKEALRRYDNEPPAAVQEFIASVAPMEVGPPPRYHGPRFTPPASGTADGPQRVLKTAARLRRG